MKKMVSAGNRAHREPVVAVVVVRVRVAGIEVQVVGVVRVRRVLRGRPVVAVRTGIVEVGDVAVARCWQEQQACSDSLLILMEGGVSCTKTEREAIPHTMFPHCHSRYSKADCL